ncbi:3170_t:CDS:2 [Entrophospora sp. SA101]|nr:3170_t:CDS:2 [Entrophospora sp. SA101]
MFSLPAARQIKDMSTWGEAWDKRLIDEKVGFYPYEEFDDVKEIADGSFGNVYRANWKTSDKVVVIKSFGNYNQNAKQVIKDLKALNCEHANFIRLYGLTKIENKDEENTSKYLLILECANGGTLRQYLKDRVQTFDWHIRLNFSLQITGAVQFLHEKNIVHGGLVIENFYFHFSFLVLDDNIRVTDHGISRRLTNFNTTTNVDNSLVPYIDPQCFKVQDDKNKPRQFRMNMKSDIYSLGFILWELTSDSPPFSNRIQVDKDLNLISEISRGLREKPVPGTPGKFVEVYIKCWQDDPAKRAEIQQTVFALKALEIKKKTSMHDQNYLARDLDIKNRLSIGTDINSLRSMLGQLALTHTTEPSIFRPKPSNLDPLLIDSTTTTTTASTTLNTPTQPTSGPSEINPGVSIEPDVTTTSFKSKNNEPPMFEKEQIQVFVEEPISTKTTETIDNHVIDSKKYDFISKLENKLEIPKKEIQKPLPEKLPDKESENINSKVTTTIAMMTKKSEPDKLTSEPSKNVPSTPSKKVESLANGLNQKILKTEEVKIGSDEKKVNKEESPSLNKKQNPNPINPIDNVVTKEIKNTSSSNNGGISIIKKRLSLSLNNDSNSTIPKLIKEPIVNSSSIAKLKSDLENNSANDKTEKVPLGNQSMNKLNKDFSLVNGSSTPKSDKETTTANKLNPISEFQQKEDTATQNTDSSLLLGLGNSVKNFKDKLEPPAPTKPNPPSTKSVKSRRISISSAKSDDSSKGDIYTPPKLSRRISIKKSDIPTRPDFPRLKSTSPPKIPDFTLTIQPLPKNETDLSQIIIQRTESALTIKSSSKSKSSWISETQINSNGTIDDIAQTPGKRRPHYKSLLGYFYYAAIGTGEDDEKAFDLFLAGAKNAIPIAQFYLAKCYQFGYGTSRSDKLTFFWYRKAAFYGSAAGENELGYCYRDGIGTLRDSDKAFEWFSRSAKRGNLEGLCNIGTCYELGKGVRKNLKKAFEIYNRTAEAGFKEGQYNLAAFYEAGTGVPKDLDQAIYWCQKAAHTGFRRAKEKLAKLLAQKQSDETSNSSKE